MRHAWLVLLLLTGCGDSGSEGGGGGGDAGGPDPFDDARLTTYDISLAQADWDAIVADPWNNTWRRCTVTWEGETYADVAIRPSGERSRIPGNPKPSVRLEFDEFVPNREFHKFSTLKLDAMTHDPSMVRARLQYPAYAAVGIPAPRYVHCRVVVNGAYKGVYGVEERLGREFLRKRLGIPVNQLYEFTEGYEDILWLGTDPSIYSPKMWIGKIDDLPADPVDLRNLVDILNNRVAEAPTVFDVEGFVRFMAAEMIAGEGDGYLAGSDGNDAENTFMTKHPATGKYMFLPWDRDQGFWRTETEITFAFDRQVLTRNLILWIPANLDLYKQTLRDLINGAFATPAMQARVDAIFAQIKDAAFADPYKAASNDRLPKDIESIKAYIANRNAAFTSQLGP